MKTSILVFSCLVVSACSGLIVEREDLSRADKRESLPGVPFYIKEPAVVQETKIKTEILSISFQVSPTDDFSKSEALPRGGPVQMPKGNGTLSRVSKALAEVDHDGFPTSAKAEAAAENALHRVASRPDELEQTVVSNTWKVDAVIGPRRHFITTRVPLFGSASANFKLASDGTLSEASASITDDTGKTLLGLAPVTSFLSSVFGVAKTEMKILKAKPEFHIRFTIVAIPTVSTLQSITFCEQASECWPLPTNSTPLKLTDGMAGTKATQLVAIATGGAAPKDAKNAFQISGSVVPPTATK